jgi:hypothetical protein
LLAEATSNQTYLDAAVQAADWIHSHLYNHDYQIRDNFSGRQNDSCATTGDTHPANNAFMIEGLSILDSITNAQTNYSL